MRISLRQLEVFTAVAQAGQVTAAGARIGLSQAAASQAIAELEEGLGHRLFDRHGRRLYLNPAGRDLLPRAIEVLDRVHAIEVLGQERPWRMVLGASVTAGNQILPRPLARFLDDEPLAEVRLIIRNTEEIVQAISRFECDLGVVEGPVRNQDLTVRRWSDDELVIIASPRHRLAGRVAQPEDLAKEDWILREQGAGARDAFERAAASHFAMARIRLEVGGNEVLKELVASNLGISAVVPELVAREIADGTLARVLAPWLNARRTLSFVWHRERTPDARVLRFVDQCCTDEPCAVIPSA